MIMFTHFQQGRVIFILLPSRQHRRSIGRQNNDFVIFYRRRFIDQCYVYRRLFIDQCVLSTNATFIYRRLFIDQCYVYAALISNFLLPAREYVYW